MKILKLDLRAFGPFTDEVLDLSDGHEGLHLIYGPNEAGKSSALRALRSFLFGIDSRTSDDFLHPYARLRIGATLRAADGTILELVRRKGNRHTLRDRDDDQPVDESILTRLLGGMDEVAFRRRYGIGYDDLVQGGREIVAGGGDLGHSLFAAASGIANLKAVQATLAAEAEKLFAPSARTREINKALHEYHELNRRMKDQLLPSARWCEHDRALQEAIAQREDLRQRIQAKVTRLAELKTIVQASPIAAQRRQRLEELRPVASAPILSDDFAEQRRRAATDLEIATKETGSAQQEIADLEESLAALHLPGDVLHHAQAIDQLREHLGSYRKAMDDRRLRVAERDTAIDAAQAILKELGRPELPIKDAEQLRLTTEQRVQIQNLGIEKSRLVERVDSARTRQTELGVQREAVRKELAHCPPARDAHTLQTALAAARAAGPLETRLRQLQAEQSATNEETRVNLARLRGWSRSLADLELLPLPADETLDRFELEFSTGQQALHAIRARYKETQQESDRLEEQIEQLRRSQDVPTEVDLEAARAWRDHGWQLVRERVAGQPERTQAVADFVGRCPGAEDLLQAYAAAVLQADHIADRLRREAALVSDKAQRMARRDSLKQQIQDLQQQEKEQTGHHEEWQRQWQTVWEPWGIDPQPPREMRAWLRQAQGLRAAARQNRAQAHEIEQIAASADGHRAALSAAMALLGESLPADSLSLEDALCCAERTLATIEADNRHREQLLIQEQTLTRELQTSQRALDMATTDLSDWAQRWAEATAKLPLRADAEPAEANAVVASIQSLLDQIRDANRLEHRIAGIDRDAKQFQADVQMVCAEVAPQLAGPAAEQIVAKLSDLLTEARAVETRRGHLQQQLAAVRQRLDAAQLRRERATALLNTMCTESQCQQPDELPAAEQNSQRRCELERDVRELDVRLLELAAGRSLDAFLDVLAQSDAQEAAADMVPLELEIESLRDQVSSQDQVIGEQRTQLAIMDGNDQAADAHQQAEQLLAKIRADAEQYARLHLSAVVLDKAIQRYRQLHQAPLLERASDQFAALTLGRFTSLRDDHDKHGAPVLVGVRSETGEIVQVEGMSDGTSDQLYLALRLASLELDAASREPLPLVVDDILIMFDDDRALATLKMLAALADKTQVIVFTHHEHIVRLAQEALDDEVLFTHQIGVRGGDFTPSRLRWQADVGPSHRSVGHE